MSETTANPEDLKQRWIELLDSLDMKDMLMRTWPIREIRLQDPNDSLLKDKDALANWPTKELLDYAINYAGAFASRVIDPEI